MNSNKTQSKGVISSLLYNLKEFRKQISNKFILVEINTTTLRIALAKFSGGLLEISAIRTISLPPEAIDRYVPSDPSSMGTLLKEVITEEGFHALKTAVVISQELAYTRLVNIPGELSLEEAYEYIRDPNSSIQLPIPIRQTDFDITPTSILSSQDKNSFRQYFLTSIPKKATSKIISTITDIGLDLFKLEVENICQLRLLARHIKSLKDNQYIISLQFLSECTHISISDKVGPIFVDRLAAIRDYPVADDILFTNDEKTKLMNNKNQKNKEYLPISQMDLKILIREIKACIKRLSTELKLQGSLSIFILGRNSNHPNLSDLISKSLRLPVFHISPANSICVGNINFDPTLVSEQSLANIIGLGMGLINSDDLFSKESLVNDLDIIDKSIPLRPMLMKPNISKKYEDRVRIENNLNPLTNKSKSKIMLEEEATNAKTFDSKPFVKNTEPLKEAYYTDNQMLNNTTEDTDKSRKNKSEEVKLDFIEDKSYAPPLTDIKTTNIDNKVISNSPDNAINKADPIDRYQHQNEKNIIDKPIFEEKNNSSLNQQKSLEKITSTDSPGFQGRDTIDKKKVVNNDKMIIDGEAIKDQKIIDRELPAEEDISSLKESKSTKRSKITSKDNSDFVFDADFLDLD